VAFMKRFGAWINRILICILIIDLTACGTILHPERKGQRGGGEIDVGVAVLDGIGLLFFIIPGVIAYAVDFSNNTIYLPRGHRSHRLVKIHVDGKMDQAAIESVLQDKLGRDANLHQPGVEIVKLSSVDDLDKVFSDYGYGEKLAIAD